MINSSNLLKDNYYIQKLSTGCKNIDDCINGGISLQGITELSGESSAGKTQFALQLLLQVFNYVISVNFQLKKVEIMVIHFLFQQRMIFQLLD